MKSIKETVLPLEQNRESVFETSFVMTMMMMVGGYMNAYTYIVRGSVFANNQTANMSKLGIVLALGDIESAWLIALPIVSAFLGAACATFLTNVLKIETYRWKQLLLAIQIVFFVIVGFVPDDIPHVFVTIPFSFIASVQLSAFRTFRGKPCNTTICTGNLRTAGSLFSAAIGSRKKHDFIYAVQYTAIILSFVAGVIIGAFASNAFNVSAIVFACLPLTVILGLSCWDPGH